MTQAASTSSLPPARTSLTASNSKMKRSNSLPSIADLAPRGSTPQSTGSCSSSSRGSAVLRLPTGNKQPAPRLRVAVTGAEMQESVEPGEQNKLFTLYTIHVQVGEQELEGRRRYSEFRALDEFLRMKHASLLASIRPLPPFPPKLLFKRSHHPEVVQERVRALDAWLRATIDIFQFVDVKAVVFLGLPFYLAVRVITGDCSADDFNESRSPDRSPEGVMELNLNQGMQCSPEQARISLLEDQLHQSVMRPGYWEASHLLAKATCWHLRVTLLVEPCFAEISRFVHAVCGRAFFKPSSIICAVVYLDRLPRSMLRTLLLVDGWQLSLLTLLIISAKQWDSDYPISTADVCSQNWDSSGSRKEVFCARRVNDTERRILKMLDYCTVVSQTEFARYYLTLPFNFPAGQGGELEVLLLSQQRGAAAPKPTSDRGWIPPSASDAAIGARSGSRGVRYEGRHSTGSRLQRGP